MMATGNCTFTKERAIRVFNLVTVGASSKKLVCNDGFSAVQRNKRRA